MLSVEHLTVGRGGRTVLDNVSFSLVPGQVTAVLGLNGAGKTTLLKAILGFLPRQGGTIRLDGQDLDRLSPSARARKLSYVPQIYDGGFQHSVEDFVSMGATAYLGAFSSPGQSDLRRAEEILCALNCAHLIGRSMAKLSGGEQRLAYLARAVMQNADCLLLDEPVSSLDLSRQHRFLGSLRRYVRARQADCLLTIHSPELAYTYAERILILHGRRVLLDTARGEAAFDKTLTAGLRTLYGPALRPRIQDGALVLGWEEDPPDKLSTSSKSGPSAV